MKKQYTSPSVKIFEVEEEDIICGSGNETEKIPSSDGSAPSTTSIWGRDGIWGD